MQPSLLSNSWQSSCLDHPSARMTFVIYGCPLTTICFKQIVGAKEVGRGVQVKAMSTVHWDQAKELPVRGISGQWCLQRAGVSAEGRGGRGGCRSEFGSDFISTAELWPSSHLPR